MELLHIPREGYDDISGIIRIENNRVYHQSSYLNPNPINEDDMIVDRDEILRYNPSTKKLE